ncbi:MAG TPA: hypothetical protein VJJ80_01320 [Patescibacteria group bacterium]|nr:hypothetical protein [Patescibacteria group bacterium]
MKKNIKHLNNLLLLILAAGFFWLGSSFLEYEYAKIRNPQATWIASPKTFDMTMGSLMLVGSLTIFVMLSLIYYKKLENRTWLWGVVIVEAGLLIVLSAVLGYNRFIWILLPNGF